MDQGKYCIQDKVTINQDEMRRQKEHNRYLCLPLNPFGNLYRGRDKELEVWIFKNRMHVF